MNVPNYKTIRKWLKAILLMNSHFSVHIADQQLQHYVLVASQTLQSSHLTPKHQSLEPRFALGHPPEVEVAYIAYSVDVHSLADIVQVQVVARVDMELCMPGHGLCMTTVAAAVVVGPVPETMKSAGNPEVNPVLAAGLVYMQGE